MPKTLATAVWPSDALQIVARKRPTDVAVRMIGSAAPMAVAGTTPTSARPSDTEPTTKQGSPSAVGSPSIGPIAGAAAGRQSGAPRGRWDPPAAARPPPPRPAGPPPRAPFRWQAVSGPGLGWR